jgi:hypothetical protein
LKLRFSGEPANLHRLTSAGIARRSRQNAHKLVADDAQAF